MIRSIAKISQLPFILLLALGCHIQLIANAQSANEIKGQVNDENGQPVTYASVLARNHSTGATTTTQTDSLGIFHLSQFVSRRTLFLCRIPCRFSNSNTI